MKFNETLKLTYRGYKIWWGISPKLILTEIFTAVVDGISPFVAIYLSARIINELAGARDPETLRTLVLAALISAFILKLLHAGLQSINNCQRFHQWYSRKKLNSDKLLSMDFAKVDDPCTLEKLNQIEDCDDWLGWGMNRLVWMLGPMVKAAITIISAFVLTFSLFTSSVPNVSLLNNPLIILLVIIVLLVITFLAPYFANKASSFWSLCTDNIGIGDRIRFFYGDSLAERERALDVRVYRQDMLSEAALSKERFFSPGSQIAKLAKGRMGGFYALSSAVSQVFTGVAYLYICLKALGGAFGIGSVTQYVASITALSGGISELVRNIGELGNNAPFLQKIFEFLDTPNEMYQGSLTVEKRSDKKYEIEFRDVSFKYPGQEVYALRHVSVKFAIGQRLAVVGMNGSGKTTFIKLLCRFYDPTEGEILLNGINIRKYDYKEYMSIFSVVFQDFQLLSAPIGQNVATKISYDENQVQRCLAEAGFEKRVSEIPDGLKTYLYKSFDESGIDVSGGEAQKIALARALYKDSAFIVLDEPTAALDPIAEFDVYSRMNEIVAGKTAVFISHRLSSCRFCQNIVVFHEGTIVERGSHDELVVNENGKYYELWNAQAQYYK